MSEWTHPICNKCWKKQNGERIPYRVVKKEREKCCFCKQTTKSGIYVRYDPTKLSCKGEHDGEFDV